MSASSANPGDENNGMRNGAESFNKRFAVSCIIRNSPECKIKDRLKNMQIMILALF